MNKKRPVFAFALLSLLLLQAIPFPAAAVEPRKVLFHVRYTDLAGHPALDVNETCFLAKGDCMIGIPYPPAASRSRPFIFILLSLKKDSYDMHVIPPSRADGPASDWIDPYEGHSLTKAAPPAPAGQEKVLMWHRNGPYQKGMMIDIALTASGYAGPEKTGGWNEDAGHYKPVGTLQIQVKEP